MQIDWVTVAAQIVNFLVLVWLLQKVLYRPLARALKEREEVVNHTLRAAEAAKADAEAQAAAHREALQALEAGRAARLQAVEDEAKALQAALSRDAHGAIARHRADWQAQLDDEKAAFLDRLRRRAGEAFVTLARRALAEMADEDLVERIARVFARRLAALGSDETARLQAAAAGPGTVSVRSSLPLEAAARERVAAAVTQVLERDLPIEFREEPELDCGIVLAVGARHVGWTLGEHLDALEAEVGRLLDAPAVAEGGA